MSVLLVPNKTKPASVKAARELDVFLSAHGIAVAMFGNDRAALPSNAHVEVIEDGSCVPEHVELVVALGGDGTILKAAHLSRGSEAAVLGVKLGRLGFLAGCDVDEMTDAVLSVLANEVEIEERATIRAEVRTSARVYEDIFALNEVVLARGASGRVISFTASIGGAPLAPMRGDGVLVATATGSTGYALSAGGPVVAPGFKGLILVPIAPHSLHTRAVVTDPDDMISIDLTEDVRGEAVLFVDGEPLEIDGRIESILVRRGDEDVRLVRFEEKTFYPAVASTFFGAS